MYFNAGASVSTSVHPTDTSGHRDHCVDVLDYNIILMDNLRTLDYEIVKLIYIFILGLTGI